MEKNILNCGDNCNYIFGGKGNLLAWSSPHRVNHKNFNSPWLDEITEFTFPLVTCSVSAFLSVPYPEQVIKLMNISMYLIFHIFIVFPKNPQKRHSFPPPPPSYRKPSSRLDRKVPRILPYVTNYSKLCLNSMFFTSIVSHFVCASEVLKIN